jgi:2-polyprenyl-3-methyl-5-hydroxy-6-metoxy-1,4-benzoquinol methylase
MKISEGLQEDGVVVGNIYDKYNSCNPIIRWIMNGFADSLSELVAKVGPRTIHEVGCGEGYWVLEWRQQGIEARGSDFSKKVIKIACENAQDRNLSPTVFSTRSIYDIEPEQDSADLIVCCEVLEHLESPEAGLAALQRVASNHVILSVPREPIWSLLNLIRGKYFNTLGNTPGHIQHWSRRKFIEFADRFFDVVEVKTPLPWTMLLCKVRR